MLWAEIEGKNFVKSIGRKIFTWNHRLLRISRCWCLKFDNSGNTESAFKIDWDTFGAEIDLSLALAIGAGSSSTDCWSIKKVSWNQFKKKKKFHLLFTFLLVWIWNEPPSKLRLSTKVRRSRSTEPARILKRDKKFREIKWSLILFLQKNCVLIWTSTFNLCIQKYRKETETREKKEIKKKKKIKQKIKLPNVIRIVCHPRKNVFVIRLLHYRIPSLNKTQKKKNTNTD